MIRILLVDDQQAVRTGLRMRLAREPDMMVVGEASDGTEALALAKALDPDVVLMDVEMPGMDGISAAAALRALAPSSRIVVLSIRDDAATQARARAAGAAAFVTKHGAVQELLVTIRRVILQEPGQT